MWHKAEWMGRPMRLKLTRVGLLLRCIISRMQTLNYLIIDIIFESTSKGNTYAKDVQKVSYKHLLIRYAYIIGIYYYTLLVECSPMAQETRVQSKVESYQRLKKWYLIPPCLTLNIIRYFSRVKWSNPGKGVVPSLTPRVVAIEKGAFGSPLTTVANFTFLLLWYFSTC